MCSIWILYLLLVFHACTLLDPCTCFFGFFWILPWNEFSCVKLMYSRVWVGSDGLLADLYWAGRLGGCWGRASSLSHSCSGRVPCVYGQSTSHQLILNSPMPRKASPYRGNTGGSTLGWSVCQWLSNWSSVCLVNFSFKWTLLSRGRTKMFLEGKVAIKGSWCLCFRFGGSFLSVLLEAAKWKSVSGG